MSYLPFFVPLLIFIVSLSIVLAASAWFTHRLEQLSDIFDLSNSLLSLLGALGANIPNYFASIVALAHHQFSEGLGVIVGSNIYNIAIILSLATLTTPGRQGIVLTFKEARDARLVALYTLFILSMTVVAIALLSQASASPGSTLSIQRYIPLVIVNLLGLGVFGALVYHALHRAHAHESSERSEGASSVEGEETPLWVKLRCVSELVLALGIALGGVVVMVQSGQDFAGAVGIPNAILGLVILAVATSLPNTVVAYSLARTDRRTASVEEVFSSNSINATLGIVLPLLLWHDAVRDALLAYLDAPLMVVLTLVALICVLTKRVSRLVALLLLITYVVWVVAHVLIQ